MTTYRFEEIGLTGLKTVKCADCGKALRRQRRFTQTLNPFNKNAAGEFKSRSEVYAELRERVLEWKTEAEFCSGCAA
jgi:ribosomal protein S26